MSIPSNIVATLGKIAGLAGIAFGVFLVLFKGTLEKNFLPQTGLTSDQAYHIMFAVLLFTFGLAGIGIVGWIIGRAAGQNAVSPVSLAILAILIVTTVIAAVFVGMRTSEAKQVNNNAPEYAGFVITAPGNPTLADMVEIVKQNRHVAITFASTCKPSQKNARIQVNGAQLSGKDVRDFFENAIRPRTSISFNVTIVQEDVSYEIVC